MQNLNKLLKIEANIMCFKAFIDIIRNTFLTKKKNIYILLTSKNY